MRARFFFLAVTGFALPATAGGAIAAGCGPSVETAPGGSGGNGGRGGSGNPSSSSSGGFEGGIDALPDYVDPGCPDAGLPIQDFACDPYHQNDGECGPGEGCYIFVQYPEEPCGQEIYGSTCAPAGPGMQGDPCNGGQECGAGFVCVVSGSGNQCVQLCPLAGSGTCPPGLVCEPIDVEGFGGCL